MGNNAMDWVLVSLSLHRWQHLPVHYAFAAMNIWNWDCYSIVFSTGQMLLNLNTVNMTRAKLLVLWRQELQKWIQNHLNLLRKFLFEYCSSVLLELLVLMSVQDIYWHDWIMAVSLFKKIAAIEIMLFLWWDYENQLIVSVEWLNHVNLNDIRTVAIDHVFKQIVIFIWEKMFESRLDWIQWNVIKNNYINDVSNRNWSNEIKLHMAALMDIETKWNQKNQWWNNQWNQINQGWKRWQFFDIWLIGTECPNLRVPRNQPLTSRKMLPTHLDIRTLFEKLKKRPLSMEKQMMTSLPPRSISR